ncbi:LysR family transcriptional regulator [Streptomyces clavifer]|uniref:LysR family transcriptional regulator n=1 Tax=Streptomyces clavifer TaxID=68188 RepID=UPI003817216C
MLARWQGGRAWVDAGVGAPRSGEERDAVAHCHHTALRAVGQAADAPAVLRDAVTGPTAWQRLERFAAVLPYSTVTEAARALGVHQLTLATQIDRLEMDLAGP